MPTAYIVAGLGFGDEGKGATVDYLCRKHNAKLVVRYNGGCQAAHNVVTPDGRHHTFSQFGSGTFAGAKTYLSKHVIINPLNMQREYYHLCEVGESNAIYNLLIDSRCLVVTPFQRAVNRLTELSRGAEAHGSCGMGIGQAFEDARDHDLWVLRAGDLRDPNVTKDKLRFIHDICWRKIQKLDSFSVKAFSWVRETEPFFNESEISSLVDRYRLWSNRFYVADPVYIKGELPCHETVVFEGAQGVLLDQTYGMHPHTTWSDCTFRNAEELLMEIDAPHRIKRIGVLRAYHTRHGAGPFPTEDPEITELLPDSHNAFGQYQGGFRVGAFDARLARYAISVCGGVDEVYMTCADRLAALSGKIPLVDSSHRSEFFEPNGFIAAAESTMGVKITNVAWGPTANDRRER